MALDAAIYPQDSLDYICKEIHILDGAGGCWVYGFGAPEEKGFVDLLDSSMEQSLHGNWESSSSSMMQSVKEWDPNSSPEACTDDHLLVEGSPMMEVPPAAPAKRKRRRTRTYKNKEELENQRMTHIAVERNRRKQMNDYLTVIRSLMPAPYVQRGDQASIIGGAINFVKELEQHLQTLEAKKRSHQRLENGENGVTPLFGEFFSYPQYSTQSSTSAAATSETAAAATENRSALADIEVTMAESHANLKILSKRRSRQLLKLVAGLQYLWFTILHLNVTTVDEMVLYSVSVKIEDGCQLTTVDEIAGAVNRLLKTIQEEAESS